MLKNVTLHISSCTGTLLTPDHPHYLDEAEVERHLASRTHPDTKDLQNAVKFLEHILKEYYAYPTSIDVSTCMDGEPCIKCGLCSSV